MHSFIPHSAIILISASIVSTMPTLRLIYLTDHQYQHAFVTPAEDETNNTRTAQLPTATLTRIHEQSRFPVDDATRNASSNDKKPLAVGGEETMVKQESGDHEDDDDDYVDTLLQEAIDEVNTRSFGSQVPHEEMISSDEKNDHGDSASSPVDVDAIQQKSGNKRKRRGAPKQSFDDRFNDLMAFKVTYGHCDVSQYGENSSLGKWCSQLRGSYKKMQNNQKTNRKLSDEQIQRLSDAGFKWSLKVGSCFDERFNDLMSFKAKYGHCDVSHNGENSSLGTWCRQLRVSYKKIQNNQKPKTKLSDNQIQRLNDAGFKWSLLKVGSSFDERFNDLMAFKAKYGHCDVSQYGENSSLGTWCGYLRGSYKKIQNNQKPHTKLSDNQIQRLKNAGFKWSLKVWSGFDKRFIDLMAFKAKYGHCDVSQVGEDASLGMWCSVLRVSYKKIQNNQKPTIKLSDEQIQRLNDAGFKWRR
jgi:hypothetical protein